MPPETTIARYKAAVLIVVLSLPLFCGGIDDRGSSHRTVDGLIYNRAGIECPPRERLDLSADIICADNRKTIDSLTALLKSDSISIIGTENYSNGLCSIRIELTEVKFSRVFNGTVQYNIVEYSSRPGSYCQRYIKKYLLPSRYKNLVKNIQIPDPQLN